MRIYYLSFLGSLLFSAAIAMETEYDSNTLGSHIQIFMKNIGQTNECFKQIDKLKEEIKKSPTITKYQQLDVFYNTVLIQNNSLKSKSRNKIMASKYSNAQSLDKMLENAQNLIADYSSICEKSSDVQACNIIKQLKNLYDPGSREFNHWYQEELRFIADSNHETLEHEHYQEIKDVILPMPQEESLCIEPIQEKIIELSSVQTQKILFAQTTNDQIAPIEKAIEQTKLIISIEEQLAKKQPTLTREKQLARIKKDNRLKNRAKQLLEIAKICDTKYPSEQAGILALIRAFEPLILSCDGKEKEEYEHRLASLRWQYNSLTQKK